LGSLTLFYRKVLQLQRILSDAILIRKIGRVQIGVSDSIKIPFSTLIGRAAQIVVPASFVSNAKDFNIILHHEIHHHRNKDTVWILIMELACCLFYLNPFMYWWKKEIAEIQEFTCDEILIRQMRVSMRDYGQGLFKVAEAARGMAGMQVGTTCMGAGPENPHQLKSFLRRRIEVFRDHQKGQRNGFFGPLIGTIGIVITASLAFGAQKSLRADTKHTPNKGVAKFNPIVQKTTEDILNKYVAKFGAKGGFVVVADPQTGQVLATANTDRDGGVNQNWALSYEMEPASVMKGIITAAAVDRNVVQLSERLNCENGAFDYGGHTYRDWKSYDQLTAAESVAKSSNICGIKIGERLGVKALETTLREFGFGSQGSASQFPQAMPGRYPKPKEIADTDYIPLISTGYTATPGFYVTPLEIVFAYGAIANDGKLVKPQSAKSESKVQLVRQVISVDTAKKMKAVLMDAVKTGTGKNAQSKIYSTAGKTSTAYRPESPEHSQLGGERGIAGFVGFAPVNEPRLVVYVGIIDPTSSADKNPHGNEHAAPVFKEVIETVLQKMKVEPDL